MIINHTVLSAAQNNNKDKLGNLLLITAQSDCFIGKIVDLLQYFVVF